LDLARAIRLDDESATGRPYKYLSHRRIDEDMRAPRRALSSFLLAFVLLTTLVSANFELRSLDVALTLNPDGSAHATETSRLFINSSQSIDLYENSFVYNDLASWIDRTGIGDLRVHVSRATSDLRNVRVRPGPVESCNILANTCYAIFVVDYDIYPLPVNGTGILGQEVYKPRTTRYTLLSDELSLPRSKTGDIILPKEMTLHIAVPDEATRLSFSRAPDNLANDTHFRYSPETGQTYYTGETRQFAWAGQTLSKFTVTYELERSLDSEILGFFNGLQSQVFMTAFSWSGLAYGLAAAAILLSLVWLHALSRK
jgi:hypothetical protein